VEEIRFLLEFFIKILNALKFLLHNMKHDPGLKIEIKGKTKAQSKQKQTNNAI